jgi:Protein of unknown function (DUF2459)
MSAGDALERSVKRPTHFPALPAMTLLSLVLWAIAGAVASPGAAATQDAAASPSAASTANAASTPVAAATVYVARRGWHIDVGMAVADLALPLASVAQTLPQAQYIFFGFGDRHFLLAKHHNAPVLLASIWPGQGLMLLTGLSAAPEQGFGADHVIRLMVGAEQMQALQAFVWKSLQTREGALTAQDPGPYEDSMYLPAAMKYSALHTCNTWVAEALRAGGFRVHSAGVIFAGQLWPQVRRLKREQTLAPTLSFAPARNHEGARRARSVPAD